LTTSPAEPNATTSNSKSVHVLDGPLRISLVLELDEATMLARRHLHIMDLAKRHEERPERLLADERGQPAHEDSGVVVVLRRELLAIGTNEGVEDGRCRRDTGCIGGCLRLHERTSLSGDSRRDGSSWRRWRGRPW
jgi:hypothetical protein